MDFERVSYIRSVFNRLKEAIKCTIFLLGNPHCRRISRYSWSGLYWIDVGESMHEAIMIEYRRIDKVCRIGDIEKYWYHANLIKDLNYLTVGSRECSKLSTIRLGVIADKHVETGAMRKLINKDRYV